MGGSIRFQALSLKDGARWRRWAILYYQIENGDKMIFAEVVGFKEDTTLMMPWGEIRGIEPGCQIIANGSAPRVPVGFELLGRVLDGLGNPLDQKGSIEGEKGYPLYGPQINPMERQRISTPLDVGVKAVKCFINSGQGAKNRNFCWFGGG